MNIQREEGTTNAGVDILFARKTGWDDMWNLFNTDL